MHNLTKIKLFRVLLWITYPCALLCIWPFVRLKKKPAVKHFFFFDRYVIGGAQRIHIDILHAIDDIPKLIYFTRKSQNDSFKKEFYNLPNSKSKDIHFWCDNLLLRLFSVHYYAFILNRLDQVTLFGSNSTFFYDLLPWLNIKSIKKIELLHNFTFGKNGMEFFGLANHQYLNSRIVYDTYTLENIKQQYVSFKVPDIYLERIVFIEPGVFIPPSVHKYFQLPLRILYAGRGGKQKRIHLINEVVEACEREKLPLVFHFAGTMTQELSALVKSKATIYGEVSDPEKMKALYQDAHVILMTSAYEGFPMFIKEGMAYGCIPLVTALPGNKMHLTNNKNALLIDAVENESQVVQQAVQLLGFLCTDKAAFIRISESAYYYAVNHFTKHRFIQLYREVLCAD